MNQHTRLTPASSKARFTAAEFVGMIQSGAFRDMRMELVDGELERMSPSLNAHAATLMMVALRLAKVADEALLRADVLIDLGQDTMVACDVALVRSPIEGHRALVADDVLLAVEVAETTLDRDLGVRRVRYAQAGIAHYWVVDANRSAVHVCGEPIDGDYATIDSIRFGEPLAVPGSDRTITLG